MTVSVVGGGLGGLITAIACAEAGERVRLHEVHGQLGGRARTTPGEFKANHGPHVLYDDGPLWDWLDARGLARPAGRGTLRATFRFRAGGVARRVPPPALVRGFLRLRRETAPVDQAFRPWAASIAGDEAAALLSGAAGVFSFHHDPGELSAAFVHERLQRVVSFPPAARYLPGGWATLVDRLAARARALGVEIVTGSRVEELPDPPVVVATTLRAASRVLGRELTAGGTSTVLLDLGLRRGRGPFIVSDLDESGWIEMFSRPDHSLAPKGHDLLQVQLGLRPGESLDGGVARAERLLDGTHAGWREREVWRRRQAIDHETGALDLPGTTWRDRPAVDQGDGVYLVGDQVAAPGLLSEVTFNAAMEAARSITGSARNQRARGRMARPAR
jgi:phytoene dehydrogenase-like protein